MGHGRREVGVAPGKLDVSAFGIASAEDISDNKHRKASISWILPPPKILGQ